MVQQREVAKAQRAGDILEQAAELRIGPAAFRLRCKDIDEPRPAPASAIGSPPGLQRTQPPAAGNDRLFAS
jgi:hypothetical protein